MSRLACLTASTALALCAGAATAQITADDAWAAVQRQYAALGVTIDANLTRQDNVLTVSGITGRLPLPQGIGTLSLSTGDVVLTENADGSVTSTMAPTYVVDASVDLLIDGEAFSMGAAVEVATEDHVVTITGTPAAVQIASTVGLTQVTLTDIRLPPELQAEAGDFDIDFFIMAEGTAATTTITTDPVDGRVTLQLTGAVTRTITDASFVAGDVVSSSVTVADETSYGGTVAFPATPIDLSNLAAALRGGLAIDISTGSGTTMSQSVTKTGGMVVTDQGQTITSLGQALSLDGSGIEVTTDFTGLDISYAIMDLLPAPVRAAIVQGSFQFAMPILATPEAQPAQVTVAMTEFEINGDLLEMIAPGASSMNGPLDLQLDLTAMMRWRSEPLDIMALIEALDSGEIVAEVPSVTLSNLDLSFGEARVVGSGDMQFDWTGVEEMRQLREPTGQARYVISGVNALLDRLAGTGLVGATEMMGLRGGLAMAGRATGPDEITGEVNISPEGVMLNGVMIDD